MQTLQVVRQESIELFSVTLTNGKQQLDFKLDVFFWGGGYSPIYFKFLNRDFFSDTLE